MAGEVGGRPQGGVGPYVFVAELRKETNQVNGITLQQCLAQMGVK